MVADTWLVAVRDSGMAAVSVQRVIALYLASFANALRYLVVKGRDLCSSES